MSFYTQSDINNYRAGWLETHPDEVLDDETVIDCLRDEHSALIKALITDDITETPENNPIQLLKFILGVGCTGYNERTVGELWEEMNERGLDL